MNNMKIYARLLKKEIEWHKKEKKVYDELMNEKEKSAFIKGLEQALYLLHEYESNS